MTLPTELTEIEAVNTMLLVIGESPVNSLDDGQVLDAVTARSILSETSQEVQSEGWHFNTEHDYPLARSLASGEVQAPENLCSFDLNRNRHPGLDVVLRGSRLYDRKSRSFSFSETIYGTVVLFLPFEEMPYSARRYINVRAARIFQDRIVGSEVLRGFSATDEARARAALFGSNSDHDDLNILTDTFDMALTTRMYDRGYL